jgi:hypothetical protein
MDKVIDYPDVMVQLEQIQLAIGDGAERFAHWNQAQQAEVWIQIGVQSEDDTLPLLGMSSSFIRFAATLGASTDIDVYTRAGPLRYRRPDHGASPTPV